MLTEFVHAGSSVFTYYFRYPLLRRLVQGEAGAVLGVTAMESRDIRASSAGPGSCTTPPPSTALTSAITSYQSPVGKQHRCRHCRARYWHRNILKSVKIFDISCGWRRCAENPRNVRGGGAAAAAVVAASLCNRFTLHNSHCRAQHQDTFTPSAATTALASTRRQIAPHCPTIKK